MKRILQTIVALIAIQAGAQVKVGDNPTTINSSAMLEVESTSKGFLPPRMTSAQMNAIASPAAGLIIHCTDCSPVGLWSYSGTAWGPVGGVPVPGVSIDCGANSYFTGNFYKSVAVSGTNVRFRVDNNSFTPVSAFDFSTAVTLSGTGSAGLTVTAGQNTSVSIPAGGTVTLIYNITGTPTALGSFTATFSRLGLTCAKTATVGYQAPAIVCANITQAVTPFGSLVNGQAYTGTVTVPYTVAATGDSYPAETVTVAGLTLTRDAGTYSSLSGNVIYNVSGTYTGSGVSENFALSLGGTNCTVAVPKLMTFSGIASCTASAPVGTYSQGLAMTGSNTKTITVTVTGAGAYSASTNTVNGVSFSGQGYMSSTGTQSIVMTATGTPTAAGTFAFTVTVTGQTTQTCTFPVTVAQPATLNCATAIETQTPAGGIFSGTSYTGTFTIPYTAGNGTSYGTASQTINGLTLTREAGTYAAGGGNIVYNLSGTSTAAGSIDFTVDGCTAIFGDAIYQALTAKFGYKSAADNTLISITQAEYNNILAVVSGASKRGNVSDTNTATGVQAGGGAKLWMLVNNVNHQNLSQNSYVVAAKTMASQTLTSASIKVMVATAGNAVATCLTTDGTPDTVWPANAAQFFAVRRPTDHCGNKIAIGIGATSHSTGSAGTYSFNPANIGGGGLTYYSGGGTCTNTATSSNSTQMYLQVIATVDKTW